ncbi:MAG: DUF192 domain-containing protein [Candidatus Pacebacteria bacterium]|nr:DUF192 domain-containing protein [Candidatus Paceibacterota bacterium]
MKHLRTKRKPNKKNIFKLIFYIALVFVIVGMIFSIGNIKKYNNKNITENITKDTTENIDIKKDNNESLKKDIEEKENVWTLNIEKKLSTKNGDNIFVEISDTDAKREQGLSGKERLNTYYKNGKTETEGMLFVFDNEQVENFWMKDMKFDLDILWLDKDYNVVYMYRYAAASSYNKENPSKSTIYSNGQYHLAKYVLEINSGITDKLNMKVGDKFEIKNP